MLWDDFYLNIEIIVYLFNPAVQAIYAQECICRLARKADTWWLYKKGHVWKTQALPFSLNDWNALQYMELWVLYIIEQRDKFHLFLKKKKVFELLCNKHMLQ